MSCLAQPRTNLGSAINSNLLPASRYKYGAVLFMKKYIFMGVYEKILLR